MLHKVSTVPGFATKQAEDMKFLADMTSRQPIAVAHGGPHILVPFAIEDGGRMGAHAHALLVALAATALAKGRRPPFARGGRGSHAPHVVVPLGPPLAAEDLCMASSAHVSPCRAPPLPGGGSGAPAPLGL